MTIGNRDPAHWSGVCSTSTGSNFDDRQGLRPRPLVLYQRPSKAGFLGAPSLATFQTWGVGRGSSYPDLEQRETWGTLQSQTDNVSTD